MTRLATAFAIVVVFAAAPLAGAASLHPGIAVVHRGQPGPPAAGPVAKVCSGPSVTVWVHDPSTGRREKECKCAPGAVGRLIENGATGAKALRCMHVAGPRP